MAKAEMSATLVGEIASLASVERPEVVVSLRAECKCPILRDIETAANTTAPATRK